MEQMIEAGEVGTVIVKDMSRLGRNYLQVGMYTDIVFVENDVRFIAINDNVDSAVQTEFDMTPIRNFCNELYARDTAKKIKSTFKMKGEREAWGYIEYEKPLTRYDCNSYELTAVQTKVLRLRYVGQDSWSRYVYEDEGGDLWKLTDCCSPREVCESRGDTPYSACNNAFDGEPDCPLAAHIAPEYI